MYKPLIWIVAFSVGSVAALARDERPGQKPIEVPMGAPEAPYANEMMPENVRQWVIEQDKQAMQAYRVGDYGKAEKLAGEALERAPGHPLSRAIVQKAQSQGRAPASVEGK